MDVKTYQVAVNNSKGGNGGSDLSKVSYRYKKFSDDFIDNTKIDISKTTALLAGGYMKVKRFDKSVNIDFTTDKYVNWQESNSIALNNNKIIIPNSLGAETPQVKAKYVSSLITIPHTTSISVTPDDNIKTINTSINSILFENNVWVKTTKDPYGRVWMFYLDIRDKGSDVDYSITTPMQTIKYIVYDTDDTILKQGEYICEYIGYVFCFGADICFDEDCNAYMVVPVKAYYANAFPIPYSVKYVVKNGSTVTTSSCLTSNEGFPAKASSAYERTYGLFVIKFNLFNENEANIKTIYTQLKSNNSCNICGFFASEPKINYCQDYIYVYSPPISSIGGSAASVYERDQGYPIIIFKKDGTKVNQAFSGVANYTNNTNRCCLRGNQFNYNDKIISVIPRYASFYNSTSNYYYNVIGNSSVEQNSFVYYKRYSEHITLPFTGSINCSSVLFNGGVYGLIFDNKNKILYNFGTHSTPSSKVNTFSFGRTVLNESALSFGNVTSKLITLKNYMFINAQSTPTFFHAGIDAKYLLDGDLIHIIYPGYIKDDTSWNLMYLCIDTNGNIVTEDFIVYQSLEDVPHNYDIYKKENGNIEIVFGVGNMFDTYEGSKGNLYKANIYGKQEVEITDIKYSIFSKQDNAWYDIAKDQVVTFTNPTDTVKVKADLSTDRWATTPEINSIAINCVNTNAPENKVVVSKQIDNLDINTSGSIVLTSTESVNNGSISWEKTYDGGTTWSEFIKGTEYEMTPETVTDLRVRATLVPSQSNESDPVIDSYTITKKETIQETTDSALAQIKTSITHMNEDIDSINTTLTKVSTDVSTTKTNVDNVAMANTHLKQDVVDLSTKIDQLYSLTPEDEIELRKQVAKINTTLNEHITNHPSGGGGASSDLETRFNNHVKIHPKPFELTDSTVSVLNSSHKDIPSIQSNSFNGYIASASSIYSGAYDAHDAFDGSLGGEGWASALTSNMPQWLQIKLPTKRIYVAYSLYPSVVPIRLPYTWYIQGSNDESNWTNIDYRTGITFTNNVKRTFIIKDIDLVGEGYLYYRIHCTARQSGQASNTYIDIPELEFYTLEKYREITGQ